MTAHPHKGFDLDFRSPGRGGQELLVPVGAMYTVGPIDAPEFSSWVCESIVASGDGVPRVIQFRELGNGARYHFKTDDELMALEAAELIRPMSCDPRAMAGRGVQRKLAADPTVLDWPLKVAWYARKVYDHPDFKISQPRVAKIMVEVNEGKEDPDAPCAMTVLRAIERNVENGWHDPYAAALPRGSTWIPPSVFGAEIEGMLQTCLFRVLRLAKGKGTHAYGVFVRRMWHKFKVEPKDLPSLRTVQRRLADIPPYVRDYLRHGPEVALRRHGHVVRRLLPECPLHTVEADDLRLDVEVVDDVSHVPLGRPWLIMIRDRRTGIVLGFALCIGAPSFQGFVAALRHAWFPKNMDAYPGLHWRYHGGFRYLVVDRASHYSGGDIHVAALMLGFEIVELPPARPQLKGGVESANGYVNEQVAHLLPGAVMGNPLERRDFEDTRSDARLTLSELRFLLTHFFCTQANEMPKRGIGPLRTMNGVPGAIWDREIGKIPGRPLIDAGIFSRLVGDTRRVAIQPQGIQFDYILYWCPALLTVLQHKDHRQGNRYACVRDVSDLGTVTLLVPFMREPIRVPATPEMATYANGLSLDVHEAFMAENTKTLNEANAATLMARSHHASVEAAIGIRGEREKHGAAEIMQGLMRGQVAKRIASTFTLGTHSPAASAGGIDMMNPPHVPETEALSPNADPTLRAPDPERSEAVRKLAFANGGTVEEIDRGAPAANAPDAASIADDDEIAAELALLDEIRQRRGQ